MKTFSLKPANVTRAWYLIDASQATLGRVSTRTASLLLGKGKPSVSPHVDGGDYVIIINADKLKVSGNKSQDKKYYRHSGFPGGLTTRSLEEVMAKDSAEVITHAVRGMLPVNKLRSGRLGRLKVYGGSEHGHHAQKPQVVELKKESKQ